MIGGRPRGVLSPARRRELRRIAGRMRRLEAELAETRGRLARSIADANAEGASVRVLAAELELGVEQTHKLNVLGRELNAGD